MTIKVGLIGLGDNSQRMTFGTWGAMTHLPSILALPDYEIVAVANSTVESARKSIKANGLPARTRAYGSPEDIANDPNVDLVVVSVAVPKHFRLAKPALEKKKDVFVEWPLGASLAEAEELTRLAATNGVKTIVGLQARAEPAILKLKQILAEGRIGRVISSTVQGSTGVVSPSMWGKGGEYYLDVKSGGNEFTIYFGHCKYTCHVPCLYWRADCGVLLSVIDTFTHVLGDFVDVQGLLQAQYKSIPIMDLSNGQIVDPAHPKTSPDHIFVQGTLENDVVASIAFKKAISAVDNTGLRWTITGTEGEIQLTTPEGHLQFDGPQGWSLKVKKGKADQAEDIDLANLDNSPAAGIPAPAPNIARLYQSFAKGSGLEATFESSLKTHRLLDRIAKSAGWEI
ncbi:hypothetical protein BX600DRAFT_428829 [Xylariales sp. PMI_506]|nr:hypothetical protein BX600DRAFT_428829 [Xylariales sp. PMI_506]